MTAKPATELLVLGLGNVLCGDDGVGVEAVARLARDYGWPAGVEVLDGGTLGLSLLGWLAAARRVILVDAVLGTSRRATPCSGRCTGSCAPARPTPEAPGTLVRLAGEDVPPAARQRLSVHQVGVSDVLDSLRLLGAWPDVLVLLGVVPATLELGLERSAAVEAALPALVKAVVAEAASLGFAPGELVNESESLATEESWRAAFGVEAPPALRARSAAGGL